MHDAIIDKLSATPTNLCYRGQRLRARAKQLEMLANRLHGAGGGSGGDAVADVDGDVDGDACGDASGDVRTES